MQRRTGTNYVKKIDFVFYHEHEIREAVRDARAGSKPQGGFRGKNHISNPTEAQAIRNVSPLKQAKVCGEYLAWPEKWLEVIDAVYLWCDDNHRSVARDRYSKKDYRQTCDRLHISDKTYYNLLNEVRQYAAVCAAQFGVIAVC